MGPKWVQNGPKGGPKMGPTEVGTKKKSKNVFSLAPPQGVIQGPPPPLKNTVLGRLHQFTPRIHRILEKSAKIPPPRADGPAGAVSRAQPSLSLVAPIDGGVPTRPLRSLWVRFHHLGPDPWLVTSKRGSENRACTVSLFEVVTKRGGVSYTWTRFLQEERGPPPLYPCG